MAVSSVQFIIVWSKKTSNKHLDKKEYKKGLKIAMSIFVLSAVYCTPYWLIFAYSDERKLYKTELGLNELFNRIIHFWMYLPCVYLTPFCILIVTNSYLIATIAKTKNNTTSIRSNWTANQTSLKTRSSKLEEKLESENLVKLIKIQNMIKNKRLAAKRTNIMLVMHIVFFFVCQFPNLILHVLSAFDFNVNYYYKEIVKFFLVINLSLNFLIYYLFSTKFKTGLKERVTSFL